MRNRFPKSHRVVSSRQLTLVLRRGGCAADGCLVVFAKPHAADAADGSQPIRLGVTIPKKTGNAVERNRWKRWIRESFRTQRSAMPAGYDYVVRPKKGAIGQWNIIQRSLPRLAKKAVQRASHPESKAKRQSGKTERP